MVYPELTIIVVGALCQGKERNDSTTLPLGDFAARILLFTRLYYLGIIMLLN
ncbi:MAG: hypothetical protein K9G11_00845 [Rickettsiaceae bacterium]|nr:hypothetical protein [Rickettsiaceae bacterium]